MSKIRLPFPYKGLSDFAFYEGAEEYIGYANSLINLIPTGKRLHVREGANRYTHSMGSGDVESVFTYNRTSGSTIVACANNKLYNAQIGAGNEITGTGTITSDEWCGCQFNGYLFIANGTNKVIRVNSSLNKENPGFTGPSPDDSVFNQIFNHKGRLYFIEKDSTSYWYTDTEAAVTGATNEVDIGAFLNNNGKLLFGFSWQRTPGFESESLAVFVTNTGEALVYSGDYPDANNWTLIARLDFPPPCNRRSFFFFGSDVILITLIGGVSFRQTFDSPNNSPVLNSITRAIYRTFTSDLSNSTYDDDFAICGAYCPTASSIMINIRTGDSYVPGYSAPAEQFVMNTDTGAWTKFQGIPIRSLVSNVSLNLNTYFFGTTSGTVGYVGTSGGGLGQNVLTGDSLAYAPHFDVRFPLMSLGEAGTKQLTSIRLMLNGHGARVSAESYFDELGSDNITATQDIYSADRGAYALDFDVPVIGDKFRIRVTDDMSASTGVSSETSSNVILTELVAEVTEGRGI